MTAPVPAVPAAREEVPRLAHDYTATAARRRLAFLTEATGVSPEHLGRYSFDPEVLAGNIENFVGVAQVPIGIAGPLLVDGEHARGTFYVPLATTEGTLVASYNRGMKLLHAAGGVRTTVMADVMQRAPAFGFDSARQARAFGDWVTANFAAIKTEAQATTQAGRLHDIEQFSASRFLFLRFNFTTGDAAGQNLTGKATQRACAWIRAQYPGIKDFCLEANLATDKKARTSISCGPAGSGSPRKPRSRRTWPGKSCAPRRPDVPGPPDQQPGQPAGGSEQQREPLRQRDRGAVRGDRPGHRQRGRVVGGPRAHRDPGRRELLLLHHHPGPDRRDLRRRDRPADPA